MGDIDGKNVCKALKDQDMYSAVLICKINEELFKAFLSRREVSFRLVIGSFIKYQMLIF